MTCQQKAELPYIHIVSSVTNASGGLTVTGNPTTMHCGGPDDFQYNFSPSSTEAITVVPGISIQVLSLVGNTEWQTIPEGRLFAYLPTDENTRIFLITGPLNAVTGLQEQFHP
jgi:uncharacterized protein YaiE (UPF0345 family)